MTARLRLDPETLAALGFAGASETLDRPWVAEAEALSLGGPRPFLDDTSPGDLWLRGETAKAEAFARRAMGRARVEAGRDVTVRRYTVRGATGTAAELAVRFGVKPGAIREAARYVPKAEPKKPGPKPKPKVQKPPAPRREYTFRGVVGTAAELAARFGVSQRAVRFGDKPRVRTKKRKKLVSRA